MKHEQQDASPTYNSSTHSCPDALQTIHSTEHDRFKKMKKLHVGFLLLSRAGLRCVVSRLSEAVFWVADFDSTPVAGSYQADEAQQVGERPGHIGGVVTTGKVPSTDLLTQNRERKDENTKNTQNV